MRVFCTLLVTLVAAGAHAQTGTLDPTFGTGGRVVLAPSGSLRSGVSSAVVLADGRVLLAGRVGADAAVLRLTAAGALDPTYGDAGVRTVDFGGPNDVFTDLALFPDGSVVASGARVEADNTVAGAALARVKPGGDLDDTFGTGGLVREESRSVAFFNTVAVASDGRIVTVGGLDGGDFVAARYSADGTPDATFGTGGLATPDLGDATGAVFPRVVLLPDGRLAVGAFALVPGSMFDTALVAFRLTAQGTLDPTFGEAGAVVTDLGPTFDATLAIAVGPDGRITLGGQAANLFTGASDLVLARYTPDGAPDAAFGDNGVVRTGSFGLASAALSVALQADGRLLVGGTVSRDDAGDFLLARYTDGGLLDPSFGTGGRTLADFGGNDGAQALAFEPNGRVVLAGQTGSPDGTAASIAVARFITDGRPSATELPEDAGRLVLAAAPNPFGSSASVTLTLDGPGEARVSVYDALGRRVATLHDGPLGAGEQRFHLDGAALAPGVYVVRAERPEGGTALRIVHR